MSYIGEGINQTRTSVETSKDEFFGTYYGQISVDPTVDPNGEAPTEGDFYFNTTNNILRVFDGSEFRDWNLLGNITFGPINDPDSVSISPRSGNTNDHSTFTGSASEITVDTDKETVVVHDGATAGGYPVAREDLDNVTITSQKIDYDNANSGLDATDVQGAIDETADETGLALIQDGVDPAVARAVAYNDIGAPVAGGYFAGVIDTIKGTIQSNDDYQTGLRYALIVAPKELEGGLDSSPAPGLTTGDLEWDTTRGGGEAGCFTRWNGFEATNVIINKNDDKYEVHNFVAEVRSQYPAVATPGGSEWYLPAMDELELLYRNFKPNNTDNDTRDFPRNFPGSQPSGENPSSVPEGFNYENSPGIPDVTFLDLFKEGNAQAIDLGRHWSTTDADEDGRAWYQGFTAPGEVGLQFAGLKDGTGRSVRPVRRVVL